jgi:hypothetical protein
MITISDTLKGILAGNSYKLYNRLISIQAGVVLADDIPAVDVREEADASLRVPETLSFKVPILDRGVSWVPSSYDHPLGIWGQRIVAQVGVGIDSGQVEWLTRGQFLVISAETSGDSVSMACAGLLYLVDEASLVSEYQPKAGATLGSIIRALVEPGLIVDLTTAPTDRTAPSNVTWSDNRLDNVANALDAWPAQAEVTVDGVLKVTPVPAEPTSALMTFSDTVNVEQFSSELSRDGAFNAVVARGAYPDTAGGLAGQEIVATGYDLVATSPFRYGGPFSPFLVPFGYESPLMTDPTMVQAAANTRLRTLRGTSGRTVSIDAVPHPAIKLGDAVAVTSARLGLSGALGRVQGYGLGHQPANAQAPLTVRLKD